MHWWHSPLGRQANWELPPGSWLAWPLCRHNAIILNPDKCVFGADTVAFVGFEPFWQCAPMKEVSRCHLPLSETCQHHWCALLVRTYQPGVIRLFSNWAHAAILPVTQTCNPFKWDDELNWLLKESKLVIISEIGEGVCIYNKSKPICLATDWSHGGSWFWLS